MVQATPQAAPAVDELISGSFEPCDGGSLAGPLGVSSLKAVLAGVLIAWVVHADVRFHASVNPRDEITLGCSRLC